MDAEKLNRMQQEFYKFRGSTKRNPIYVLDRSEIPTQFSYSFPDHDDGQIKIFNFEPIIKEHYQSYDDATYEHSDVPGRVVIDETDLQKLFPNEKIPNGMLAYFEIEEIAITFSQDYFELVKNENVNTGDQTYTDTQLQSSFIYLLNYFSAFYFIGKVKMISNFCMGKPTFAFYTLDSKRALEANIHGKNLNLATAVIFTFPNGVRKYAKILNPSTSALFANESAMIDKRDIWRDTSWRPEEKTLEDSESSGLNVKKWVDENYPKLKNVDPDSVFLPGKEVRGIETKEQYDLFRENGVKFTYSEALNAYKTDRAEEGIIALSITAATSIGVTIGTILAPGIGSTIGGIVGFLIGGLGGAVSAFTIQIILENRWIGYTDQFGNEYYINTDLID